jgi:hypothetical protein
LLLAPTFRRIQFVPEPTWRDHAEPDTLVWVWV